MWQKIKLIFGKMRPTLITYLKFALKFTIDVIGPVLIQAVVSAEVRGKAQGWDSKQKFNYAVDYVQGAAPEAAFGAIVQGIQETWADQEANGWPVLK